MNVKKFTAPTSREALRKVREAVSGGCRRTAVCPRYPPDLRPGFIPTPGSRLNQARTTASARPGEDRAFCLGTHDAIRLRGASEKKPFPGRRKGLHAAPVTPPVRGMTISGQRSAER